MAKKAKRATELTKVSKGTKKKVGMPPIKKASPARSVETAASLTSTLMTAGANDTDVSDLTNLELGTLVRTNVLSDLTCKLYLDAGRIMLNIS